MTSPRAERAFRVDRVTGHRELERDRERNALREADETTGGGHQTPLHFGNTEAGRVGRHHEIARQHDLEAAGEGRPVDRRDQRLREVTVHDARETALAAGDVHAASGRDDLEIGAGGEHLTRAREHDGAQAGVGLDLVEDRRHRLAHLGADRVARAGAIERDERDVAAPLERCKGCVFTHECGP